MSFTDRKRQNSKKNAINRTNNTNANKTNIKKNNIRSIDSKRNEQINRHSKSYPKGSTYNRNNTKYKTNTRNIKSITTIDRINSKNKNTIHNRNIIKNKKIYRPKKKTRNRNISIISKIFTFIIFTIIIAYFSVSLFKSLNKKPINYETIKYGSIDDVSQIRGIIIRNEVVYKSSKNGVLTFNKIENERVKKGEVIANIKNEKEIAIDQKDVERINEKILQLQSQRDELSIFYEDIKRIDGQIQKILDNSIDEISTYNVEKLYEIKNSVSKKLNIRNQVLLSENSGSIQELSDKKASKEQNINKNTETIITNDSGILSYYTDGLEETFNFETKDTLTKEQTLMKPDAEQQYKLNVLEGDTVFKVVTDNDFYIASYINTQSISTLKEGQTREIYINYNGNLKPLEVIIEKIDIGEKDSYVLMKSNKNMIDFIDERTITFQISKPRDGFKINLNAISEEELLKIPTSYITDSNVIKKSPTGELITTPVKISGQDDNGEYTYVSILPSIIDVGDYIVNPQSKEEQQLNEIFTNKGIFIVNSGIYTFKSIDTEGSIQNNEFIILDPSINQNIKIYDRYAPDLSVVKRGEILQNDS